VRLLIQDSAAGSYFEGDESRIHPLWFFLIDILIISSFSRSKLVSSLQIFRPTFLFTFISLSHVLCFAYLFLPYFITLFVFEELVMQSDWAVLAYRIKYWKEDSMEETCGKTTIEMGRHQEELLVVTEYVWMEEISWA
jgi:hypothetical protein